VRYLLDSHTFLWAASAPRKLSRHARRICEQTVTPLVISVASLWEITAKCGAGKLSIPQLAVTLPIWVARMNMQVLPLEAAHAYAIYGLPMLHKDPFDRMLIAQAIVEDLVLVSNDEDIHRYAVKWAW
jgi:PIN domain nuclease of toxin-antitoxin system